MSLHPVKFACPCAHCGETLAVGSLANMKKVKGKWKIWCCAFVWPEPNEDGVVVLEDDPAIRKANEEPYRGASTKQYRKDRAIKRRLTQ